MKKSRSIFSIQYRSFFNWSRHILFVFTQVSDLDSHALKGQQHFRIYFKLLAFQAVPVYIRNFRFYNCFSATSYSNDAYLSHK